MENEHKKQITQLKNKHNTELENERALYEHKRANLNDQYDKNLVEQRTDFNKTYSINAKQHQSSLQNQNRLYMEALKKQRVTNQQSMDLLQNFGTDPFYQHKDFNVRMVDTPSMYKITLEVPEHEKNNVHVKVNGKDLIIEGFREFKDEISNEENSRKISTNSYQSFREAISLEDPILAKSMKKMYKDGELEITFQKVNRPKRKITPT